MTKKCKTICTIKKLIVLLRHDSNEAIRKNLLKMSLQNLKENREAILKIIATYTTAERTKEAMEILADGMNLKYAFTENVLTYANDTLSIYFGKQKVGIAEMISEINDHKTFNLLTKKYN